MRKKKVRLITGQRYGRLTILGEAPRDKHGHKRYRVACDCGFQYDSQPANILKQRYGCRNCCVVLRQQDEHQRHIGEKRNGWHILSFAGSNESGVPMYHCRCLRCGGISPRTYGQIYLSKSSFCGKCKPNYHFVVFGDSACGTLRDGTLFWIDAAMIPRVGALYWKKDKQGYIVGGVPIGGKKRPVKLHRFVLYADENAVVDHINRNPLDCRTANLREVTPHQNSLNKSYNKKSISGYLGVTKIAGFQRFQARIGLNNRMIHLGVTNNPIEAAQLYNTAAQFLYGEFVGELNPVPNAPVHIVQKAIERCRAVVGEAAEITQQRPEKHSPQETNYGESSRARRE